MDPFSALRNVLQYKTGMLYNEKPAKRYGKSYTGGECAMCQEPDSAVHIIGRYLHKIPKGMIIKRHNEAIWELPQFLCGTEIVTHSS